MAIRPILTFPHPLLAEPCAEVTVFGDELSALVQDLTDTMRAAPGVGITAAHIGILQRLFVMELTDGKVDAYINPKIIQSSTQTTRHTEGSVSLPGMTEEVERPAAVTLTYQTTDGALQTIEADGFLATCIQHEVDQLDGVFWTKRLSRIKRDRLMKKWDKQKRA
jgi:peptide deformylase